MLYKNLIQHGFPPGLASDDGVGLHFEGIDLVRVVTERPGACADRVELAGAEVVEEPLPAELLV